MCRAIQRRRPAVADAGAGPARNPDLAFALSRLADTSLARTAIGVFRAVRRATYDDLMAGQIATAQAEAPADLDDLLRGKDTWTVGA